MSTATSAIFTGSSQFSQDFQNIITRATAIASLPITQLNADKTSLTSQSTALTGLDGKFQALQTAIGDIQNALAGSSFQADVSDDSKLGVSLGTGAMEGNYSVDVVDAGTYATSMTAANWVAGSGTRSYRLSIGGVAYALSPADNSAAAVASAINSQYGDKVHATVVNVGSSAAADYRISLQAAQLGDLRPGLLVGPSSPASLQTQQTRGSGTLATSRTSAAWDDNPARAFQLSFNGQAQSLSPADNSAQGVADAINSQYGGQVTASLVNLGTTGDPDYRISLEAVQPGNVRPDILADDGVSGPTSLQTQQAAGSDAKAVSQTTATWAVNTGPTLTYQLSLGGATYALSPADNTAAALISAINTNYGDKVHAALADLGTSKAHDYRIMLTALQPGDLQPNLAVSETSLATQQATGAEARYMVNNSGREVTSATRSVTIATGITVNLLARDNGTPVNVTVMRPTSVLAQALASFTDAYNAAVDELDKQHGQTSGALAGQSLVTNLSQVVSGLATYAGSGQLTSLAALGLDLDKTGHLSFDSFALMATDLTNSTGVTAFLGDSSSSGFLKWASDSLSGVEDANSGLLAVAQGSVQDQIADIDNRITDTQARVDQMTGRLQEQMAATDALISSMEQQYNYLSGMFEAMQTAAKQYG